MFSSEKQDSRSKLSLLVDFGDTPSTFSTSLVSSHKGNETVVEQFLKITQSSTNIPLMDIIMTSPSQIDLNASFLSTPTLIPNCKTPNIVPMQFLKHNDTFDEAMVKNSVEFIPLGLALWIVCIFGLFGNVLSAAVLQRPKMKSTYSILTLGLTFCDIAYLLMKLLRYGILSLFDFLCVTNTYTEVVYPIIGNTVRAITFTAHSGSTYFTVALAIDRYISVCWPVKARSFCTKRRAYLMFASVFFSSILYNAPRWLEFHTEISTVFNETLNRNVTLYTMEISTLRRNPLYKSLYIFWGYFLVIFFIPFTSLSFFNYKIFREVRRSNKARRKLTYFQKREISFATMLVSIIAFFLICSTDYLVIDLLTYFNKPYPPFWDQLGNFLLTVNSAGNFIIYCAFGRKFRQELKAMLANVCWGQSPRGRGDLGSARMIPDLICGTRADSKIAIRAQQPPPTRAECQCQNTIYL